MSDRGSPSKPSTTEDEYFVREDAEKKRKLALQVKKETESAELKRLKELHFMRCPKCGLQLQEVKYSGVDVDVCFACGGVFLDKGELEHISKPGKDGVMSAILNWFKPETGAP
ncbi:MAG: zf-TFIIB domain-containing protein [Anaeromyxobacteraceae bacterium]|nr:zf-TFIIB domain-containing protein [Anaeromyxobacteraceae bacterium]